MIPNMAGICKSNLAYICAGAWRCLKPINNQSVNHISHSSTSHFARSCLTRGFCTSQNSQIDRNLDGEFQWPLCGTRGSRKMSRGKSRKNSILDTFDKLDRPWSFLPSRTDIVEDQLHLLRSPRTVHHRPGSQVTFWLQKGGPEVLVHSVDSRVEGQYLLL
jgi:hypothetical protein